MLKIKTIKNDADLYLSESLDRDQSQTILNYLYQIGQITHTSCTMTYHFLLQVERRRLHEPAAPNHCIKRRNRVLRDEDKQTTCGSLSLTEYHYNTCVKLSPTDDTPDRE